ncbi:shikimate dehydrogenase family protein [Paractinoplanes globisporus]|uniref:Shikimate dehydrogenase family protein n=1 Tax=Paractinoplanes globisporus TaxID=113565 RepID=A0ABW6WLF5_9ACTN|nr:hypothetical protein [Actinoplanes globisporus]
MSDVGRDIRLVGRDLPVGAAAESYRALVSELKAAADVLGAVITSHKVAVVRAADDLIDSLDPVAVECGEVNALRREGTFLRGFARDPMSVGRVVDEIWPRGEHVVCLGAGGSAIALGRHLLSRPEPPSLVFADRSAAAAAHLESVLASRTGVRSDGSGSVEAASAVVHVGPGPWDELVAGSPPGTLVVNATGLGKDRPGSPLSAEADFPRDAVLWELNYRGDLALLRQAERQGVERHDGWQLFCHGWAAALGPILDLPDEAATARRFAELAAPLRPRTGGQ